MKIRPTVSLTIYPIGIKFNCPSSWNALTYLNASMPNREIRTVIKIKFGFLAASKLQSPVDKRPFICQHLSTKIDTLSGIIGWHKHCHHGYSKQTI